MKKQLSHEDNSWVASPALSDNKLSFLHSKVSSQEESKTRSQIFYLLLQHGSLTAVELANSLELAPGGIRRHLESMMQAGYVAITAIGSTEDSKASRGRPAKYYELTTLGHRQIGDAYAELASDAISAMHLLLGHQGVCDFAQSRLLNIIDSHCSHNDQYASTIEKVHALESILTQHGYAASVRQTNEGIEICQHHCPFGDIAEKFPAFCEGENQAFSVYFQRPVHRLATIASGSKVCTTVISLDSH